MATILQKSASNQSLSPMERALLRLGKSLLLAFMVATVAILTQALITGKVIDANIIYSAAMAGGFAVLAALQKFFSAIGDTQLVTATDSVMELDKAVLVKTSGGMKLGDVPVDTTDYASIATAYENAKGPIAPIEAVSQPASLPIVPTPVVALPVAPAVAVSASPVPPAETVPGVTFVGTNS